VHSKPLCRKFMDVLCVCRSEVELEEVLTVYTRLSRSASVFLRSNSRPVKADARPASESSSACVSPVKGQGQGRDMSPSGKPRAKDQFSETHTKHSSTDKHEGSVHVCY